MRILDLLFPPREDEATLRDVSKDDFLALVAPRMVETTRPQTIALFPFAAPSVRAAIHEAKYHGGDKALEFLGDALAEYLRDAEGIGTSVLVPVPLGALRRRERGFNQVEEVARRAANLLGRAVRSDMLVRTRETKSQISLPRREREENMRGAFRAAHPVDLASTYIIVDDVTTTGATLQAAIDALKDAGAVHITPLALAH